jgi:hypothetical protein
MTEIDCVMGSSRIHPADNYWWARLKPASGKKHLFPGDDKEEKVDNNILGFLSRNIRTAFMLGKGQRDPLPSQELAFRNLLRLRKGKQGSENT